MTIHELAILIVKSEEKTITLAEVKEVLKLLRKYLNKCRSEKLYDALNLLVN